MGLECGLLALTNQITASLPQRLRDACNGHPSARIPWPHRLLHEAADRIEQLEASPWRTPQTEEVRIDRRCFNELLQEVYFDGEAWRHHGTMEVAPEPKLFLYWGDLLKWVPEACDG